MLIDSISLDELQAEILVVAIRHTLDTKDDLMKVERDYLQHVLEKIIEKFEEAGIE